MPVRSASDPTRGRRQGVDAATLQRHFGSSEGLLPLWIAETSVDLAPEVTSALQERAVAGWYGYETRPESIIEAFWGWMRARCAWDGSSSRTLVSPSVGTSIAVLIEQLTAPGDGVILQPPVYTGFKPLVTSTGRRPVGNALALTSTGYRMDMDDLAAKASDPATTMLILCNPHNPVGRVWTKEELRQVAAICAEHDVFVLADEIHSDIVLPPHQFTPFALAAAGTDVVWAATHGPIKTFGLAGVCDTLLITDRDSVADDFATRSAQLHLTRNNVFGLTAFETAYQHGEAWLEDLLDLVSHNVDLLRQRLPEQIRLAQIEGTFLAWLDLRELGLDVRETPGWLATNAGLALSPGHWFGREGAGFARMTIAAPSDVIAQAADQLTEAVARR